MPGKSSWWIDQNDHFSSCFHPNLATRIWYHSIVLKSVGLFVVYFNWPRTTQYAESKYSSFQSNICERKAGKATWEIEELRRPDRSRVMAKAPKATQPSLQNHNQHILWQCCIISRPNMMSSAPQQQHRLTSMCLDIAQEQLCAQWTLY